MSNYVIVGGELCHYGVKGMKWGVRRYQNKDGSLTPAGKKRNSNSGHSDRAEMVKKLARNEFDADKKLSKASDEYRSKEAELKKTLKEPKVWLDKDGRLTKEARDYYDKFDNLYQDYSRKESKLWDEKKAERDNLQKSVFLADDVRPSIVKAREVRKNLDNLYRETVDYKSKAYQDAWKEYSKKYGDNDDTSYGFDHYYWPSSKERKQALADYKTKSSQMEKQYNDLVIDIGKTITDGFGDQKISDSSWYNTYEEWGRNEADEIIRFNRLGL